MKQTSLEEIKATAGTGDYKRIPVVREIMADIRTPVETLRVLLNVTDHAFLLESVEDSRQWGRYSFLGIVADSVPEKEYQECVNKAKAVVEAMHIAEEIEE